MLSRAFFLSFRVLPQSSCFAIRDAVFTLALTGVRLISIKPANLTQAGVKTLVNFKMSLKSFSRAPQVIFSAAGCLPGLVVIRPWLC
jgi:hypothetical protein